MVTHDIKKAVFMGDRIAFLNLGPWRAKVRGSPETCVQSLGTSSAAERPGQCEGGDAEKEDAAQLMQPLQGNAAQQRAPDQDSER
mgnify:CR=1 FL=1